MGEGGRNGDVSGPTTPYVCGDLGGPEDAVKACATSTATPSAIRGPTRSGEDARIGELLRVAARSAKA